MSWWFAPIAAAIATATAVGAVALRRRKPGTPTPVQPTLRERRVRQVLAGPRLLYGLGAGGQDPTAPSPAGPYVPRKNDSDERIAAKRRAGRLYLDCSGFVAYVLGIPRKIPGYAKGWNWLSTDGVIADANDPEVEIVEWAPLGLTTLRPWTALVVYGSVDTDHDGDRDQIGHIGIVSSVPDRWVYTGPASLADLQICHCAASYSDTGAVRISSGAPWAKRGRLVIVI